MYYKEVYVCYIYLFTSQSAEAASNPRKPPPKFRLVTRRDDCSPVNGTHQSISTHVYMYRVCTHSLTLTFRVYRIVHKQM